MPFRPFGRPLPFWRVLFRPFGRSLPFWRVLFRPFGRSLPFWRVLFRPFGRSLPFWRSSSDRSEAHPRGCLLQFLQFSSQNPLFCPNTAAKGFILWLLWLLDIWHWHLRVFERFCQVGGAAAYKAKLRERQRVSLLFQDFSNTLAKPPWLRLTLPDF
jgi:hypothetical protein